MGAVIVLDSLHFLSISECHTTISNTLNSAAVRFPEFGEVLLAAILAGLRQKEILRLRRGHRTDLPRSVSGPDRKADLCHRGVPRISMIL